ncbi:MAG: GNAT family N-acetyltransferase [Clostridium sp.]|uniref:GNAT family N-acetyltransferase n=1 Tax=Clostridium sp. TaxID=1506 RepID=UPI003D6CFD8C
MNEKMREVINIGDRNLIESLRCSKSCATYMSILNGTNKGKIWVDSLEKPSFAIVWGEHLEGFQLMGKPLDAKHYKDLRVFFESELNSFLKDRSKEEFEYAADTEELLEMMNNVFYDKNIEWGWQYNYKVVEYKTVDLKNQDMCSIVSIDTDFFHMAYSNVSYVLDEIAKAWGNVDRYLDNGIGFAVIKDNEIASKIISIAAYDGNYVLGVDTLASSRRLGYASLLLRKVLNDASEKGYSILWDCDGFNEASKKTAQNQDLVFDYKYKVCWVEL